MTEIVANFTATHAIVVGLLAEPAAVLACFVAASLALAGLRVAP